MNSTNTTSTTTTSSTTGVTGITTDNMELHNTLLSEKFIYKDFIKQKVSDVILNEMVTCVCVLRNPARELNSSRMIEDTSIFVDIYKYFKYTYQSMESLNQAIIDYNYAIGYNSYPAYSSAAPWQNQNKYTTYFNRGIAYKLKGNFLNSIHYDKSDFNAYVYEFRMAIDNFSMLIKFNQFTEEAYYNRADIHYLQYNLPNAISDLKKAILLTKTSELLAKTPSNECKNIHHILAQFSEDDLKKIDTATLFHIIKNIPIDSRLIILDICMTENTALWSRFKIDDGNYNDISHETIKKYYDEITNINSDNIFEELKISIRIDSGLKRSIYNHGYKYSEIKLFYNAILKSDKGKSMDIAYPLAYFSRAKKYFINDNILDAISNLKKGMLLNPELAKECDNFHLILIQFSTEDLSDITRKTIFNILQTLPIEKQLIILYHIADTSTVLSQHFKPAETGFFSFFRKSEADEIDTSTLAEYRENITKKPAPEKTSSLLSDLYYAYRGNSHFESRQFGQAIEYYNSSIENDKSNVSSYSNRGISYLNLGNFKQCVKDLSDAITLDPACFIAYSNLGFAYMKLDDHHQAITAYSNALALNDQDALTYYHRASAHYLNGNLSAAISDLKKGISLDTSQAKFCSHFHYIFNQFTLDDLKEIRQSIIFGIIKSLTPDKQIVILANCATENTALWTYFKPQEKDHFGFFLMNWDDIIDHQTLHEYRMSIDTDFMEIPINRDADVNTFSNTTQNYQSIEKTELYNEKYEL